MNIEYKKFNGLNKQMLKRMIVIHELRTPHYSHLSEHFGLNSLLLRF